MATGIDHSRLKAIIGGSAGNLVEWYDWYAYSVLSIYFAPVFFPDGDATAQLLNTAAIFAVGFLMRPIGAWIMGIYADRHGRKSGLALSVGLMCAGSLLIAVAPGYATIGVAAPLILVLACGYRNTVLPCNRFNDRSQGIFFEHDLDVARLALHQVSAVTCQEILGFLQNELLKCGKSTTKLYWSG